MAKKRRTLKKSERALIREIEPGRLAELDEDELLALHKRVRRARKKHATTYRRKAAAKVEKSGGRGAASGSSIAARHRASVFEDALATVSSELARAAHRQAQSLRSELVDEVRKKKAWKVDDADRRSRRRKDRGAPRGRRKDAARSNGARW